MQALSDFQGSTIQWTQANTFRRSYELRSENDLLGTLAFRSAFGTFATAETADGKWTFKRVGFLNPRVTVRPEGGEEDAGLYQPKIWGDGVLTLQGGPTFAWKPTNFWQTNWAFIDAEQCHVMDFTAGVDNKKLRDIFKVQCTVALADVSSCRSWVPLLVPLGMYLLILHHDDAAATTAAVG